jgi:hypothetical protein
VCSLGGNIIFSPKQTALHWSGSQEYQTVFAKNKVDFLQITDLLKYRALY